AFCTSGLASATKPRRSRSVSGSAVSSKRLKARSKSVSVTMPASLPSRVTGSAETRQSAIASSAAAKLSSASMPRGNDADDSLAAALDAMALCRVSALPVTREGKLAGIVTETDLLRALSRLLETAEPLTDLERRGFVALANPLVQK